MYKNVYLTELIAGDSPPEFHSIRKSIRDKLISKGIPVTENIHEAHFMIIFFTRGFIRQHLDILFNLHNSPIGHSYVMWDHKEYSHGYLPFHRLISSSLFDYELNEELEGDYPDGDVGDNDEFRFKVRNALLYMGYRSLFKAISLRDGRYFPSNITDIDYLINAQVEAVVHHVNPFSIELPKIVGFESDLLKLALLVNNNDDETKGGTRFLVISGSRQTHDITNITKAITTEYFLAFPPFFSGFRYFDNISQFCPQLPLTLANGVLADCLGLSLTDFDNDLQQEVGNNLKFLFLFEEISSLDELKEIRKLGDLCNQIGRGSMIVLSTELDIFRECEGDFKSHESIFLGYVDGPTITDQSACRDIAADGWRPFCLKLNDSQLGDVIKMTECRDRGDTPKDLVDSKFVGAKKGVGEGAKELSRGRIEEAVGDSKRFKLI